MIGDLCAAWLRILGESVVLVQPLPVLAGRADAQQMDPSVARRELCPRYSTARPLILHALSTVPADAIAASLSATQGGYALLFGVCVESVSAPTPSAALPALALLKSLLKPTCAGGPTCAALPRDHLHELLGILRSVARLDAQQQQHDVTAAIVGLMGSLVEDYGEAWLLSSDRAAGNALLAVCAAVAAGAIPGFVNVARVSTVASDKGKLSEGTVTQLLSVLAAVVKSKGADAAVTVDAAGLVALIARGANLVSFQSISHHVHFSFSFCFNF